MNPDPAIRHTIIAVVDLFGSPVQGVIKQDGVVVSQWVWDEVEEKPRRVG